MKTIPALEKLIVCLGKLPGIGRRSAERIAVRLVIKRETLLKELAQVLQEAGEQIVSCSRCGGLTPATEEPCKICTDPSRDSKVLCVVEDPVSLLMIENSGAYRGRYHVLMGKLSPMQGQGPDDLRLASLKTRIKTEAITEVILALNSDVESDATSSFIHDMLSNDGLRVTRLATGIPAGSGITYSDSLTLAQAIKARQQIP